MNLPAEALTASGALMFASLSLFLLVAWGKVGTKRQLDDKDREIAALREAGERKDAALERKDRQIEKLMVIGETVSRVMAAIDDLARQQQGWRRR